MRVEFFGKRSTHSGATRYTRPEGAPWSADQFLARCLYAMAISNLGNGYDIDGRD